MCGVFGIYGHQEAANLTYLGLHALQHRGQESAGVATSDGQQISLHRGMGQVIDVFPPRQMERLTGQNAIGHVRYSTAGGSFLKNAQPLAIDYRYGHLALAHNGNLTNANQLREELERNGSIFQSASDSEVVVHLMAASPQKTTEDRLADALGRVEGAYSLLCLTETKVIAIRDPFGFRPLCLGRMRAGNRAYVVASESTSFSLIEAEFIRDVLPGEMIILNEEGITSTFPFQREQRSRRCIFEYIYFARPDSTIDGVNVYEARKAFGRALAEEDPVEADVVVPVPDSGVPATIGYAERAKIPFEIGLVRSHYIGRTFIEPQQSIRHFGVRLKLSPVPEVLRGKRVVVVDDSIVRGTTSRKIVKMIRDAGAKEVHLRISSPPTRWPCYYGIDTPTRSELIASSHTIDEINQYITSDTLAYLSYDRMIESVVAARNSEARNVDVASQPGTDGHPSHNAFQTLSDGSPGSSRRRLNVLPNEIARTSFCDACFTGDYPVAFQPALQGRQLPLLDV
jgi:amidophosphoribosyltransferase